MDNPLNCGYPLQERNLLANLPTVLKQNSLFYKIGHFLQKIRLLIEIQWLHLLSGYQNPSANLPILSVFNGFCQKNN